MLKKINFIGLLVLIFIVGNNAFAQDEEPKSDKELAQDRLDIGDEIMKATNALEEARDMYIGAADLDPDNIRANWEAGNAIINTINKERAVSYFQRVYDLDPKYRFDISYWIGRANQYAMNFDEALKYLNIYRDQLVELDGYRGRDKVALRVVDRNIEECRNAKEFIENPAHFAIVNVGSAINTEFEDYGPVINADETEMVFTSRRREGNLNENVADDNKPYEDIFISVKKDGQWQPAENIGYTVNTLYHDSNTALSSDGKMLFTYKDENNGDIYYSTQNEDKTWTEPIPIGDNINSSFKEGSVSISSDGSMLFFSSNRPGHEGDEENLDLYFSVKNKKGEWDRPKTLGPEINTEYDDDGPFIDYDGRTLYFSSKGLKGMGGYDIFKSEYDSANNVWGPPVNLGYPINTPDNDIYFVGTKDGKRGYYASVREDGLGYTDIYMVTIPEDDNQPQEVASKDLTEAVEDPNQTEITGVDTDVSKLKPVVLTVNIEDNESELPLDAKVGFKTAEDNIVIPVSRTSVGTYKIELINVESRDFMLAIEKPGYIFQNSKVTLAASKADAPTQITRTVHLQKVKSGVVRVLRNIYFDFDKATFKQVSYEELNKLEKLMATNPGYQVEIRGHTDVIGSKAYNKQLSERRAQAVKSYLVSKGVDTRRITTVGFGSEQPLASNDDENEGRELNRRVEFKIVK